MQWRRAFLIAGCCMVMMICLAPAAAHAQAVDPVKMLLSAPWHGSYVCNQGLTRLRLTLRSLPGGDRSQVEAEFSFSADSANPTVPTGSFRLTGTFNPTGQFLVLKHDRWLEQPADPSYRMVDMEGRLSVGDGQALIGGRVTTYGCQDFAVWQFFAESAAGR